MIWLLWVLVVLNIVFSFLLFLMCGFLWKNLKATMAVVNVDTDNIARMASALVRVDERRILIEQILAEKFPELAEEPGPKNDEEIN